MGITEILFIVLGVALVVVSFLVPEKYDKAIPRDTQAEEEKIKTFLEQEMKQAQFQLEEKMDETITAVTDKAERYMERISNEKMMALNEYSDTVLDTIHKNHEEAVFLYDMLNNKHVQVKNTAAELNHTVEDVRKQVEEVKEIQETQEIRSSENKSGEARISEEPKTETPTFTPLSVETLRVELPAAEESPAEEKKAPAKRRTPAKKTTARTKKKTEVPVENEAMPDAQMENGMNNNDRILQLHKEGKSNMAIAKTLGLGVGEVKLVIDLFEGA